MDDMSLISLATGPFSSLVLLSGMGLGAWRFVTTTVVPLVSRWVDEQQAQSAELLRQHEADREAWLRSMKECREQGMLILEKLDDISGRIPVRRP
jgi:hypothetical protein